MIKFATVLILLSISPVVAQECNQGPAYGDCSRNNLHYRHGNWRSEREPYYRVKPHYDLHNRAASKREGFHERADSVRQHRR